MTSRRPDWRLRLTKIAYLVTWLGMHGPPFRRMTGLPAGSTLHGMSHELAWNGQTVMNAAIKTL